MHTQDTASAREHASAVLVGLAKTSDAMAAPRATFTTTFFEPKRGKKREALAAQARIAHLRERNQSSPTATRLHASMMRDLMRLTRTDKAKNVVCTLGKNDLLDKYFAGSAYTAAWFCQPISAVTFTAVAVGDTAASHAGWTEAGATNAPNYGAGTRPAFSFATAASAGSKASSAAASFTFGATGTIKGLGCSSSSVKDGTAGVLYNAVLFAGGDQPVVNGNVVNVNVTFTIT